jgi:hypothetical protein
LKDEKYRFEPDSIRYLVQKGFDPADEVVPAVIDYLEEKRPLYVFRPQNPADPIKHQAVIRYEDLKLHIKIWVSGDEPPRIKIRCHTHDTGYPPLPDTPLP